MICVDTTFLIDLWRCARSSESTCVRLLRENAGETFAAPAHAVGEFLELLAYNEEAR